MQLGFTFSIKYCHYLGLDWKESLQKILDLCQWEYIRLPVYWDRVEGQRGECDFEEIREQLEIIKAYKTKVVLVVGYRNPRWPERHGPEWLEELSVVEFEQELLGFVEKCVREFRDEEIITAWQVENEPFEQDFGQKGYDVRPTYTKELELVRGLDSRPCLITYGYKPWRKTFQNPDIPEDIVGLDVYSKIGIAHWSRTWYLDMLMLPFGRYRFKRDIEAVKRQGKSIWITELQAEPWDPAEKCLHDEDIWKETISPERLARNLKYVERAGAEVVFVWGVEWWLSLGEERCGEFVGVLRSIE